MHEWLTIARLLGDTMYLVAALITMITAITGRVTTTIADHEPAGHHARPAILCLSSPAYHTRGDSWAINRSNTASDPPPQPTTEPETAAAPWI